MNEDTIYMGLIDKLEIQSSGLPNKIQKRIFKYQRYLYGISSVILLNNYRQEYIGKLPDLAEIGLVQYDMHGETMVLNKLRSDVVKELDKYMR